MFLSKAQSDPGLAVISQDSDGSDGHGGLYRSTPVENSQSGLGSLEQLDHLFENESTNQVMEDSTLPMDFQHRPNRLKNRPWISWCQNYMLLYPLILVCVWSLLYTLWDDMALPGGALFALLILEFLALVLGQVSERLGLPGFLGMLMAGFLLRNVPSINIGKDLPLSISSPLRGISVVILLTRGALSVNYENIRKFSKVVPVLAVGSCIAEAVSGSLAVYFIIGFSIEWAIFMGFIMSAMSGLGVMPYLNQIENDLDSKTDSGSKEVIVIAKTACGLDAMLAICLAKFSLGFVFCETSTVCGFSKGPLEVLFGGAFGTLWGGLSGLLLNNEHGNDLRTIAVFSGGVMSLVGLTKIGYPRGGPLGVFLGALIASSIWRRRRVDGTNNDQLSVTFTKLWFVFQPILFGILGARTDFQVVDWPIVAKGVACLGISLSTRMAASFTLTRWSNLSIHERLFITIAWIPKGTVQAALGPVALDTALHLQLGDSFTTPAQQVMNMSAAIIVTTSIIGPIVLKMLGHRLLTRTKRKIAGAPNTFIKILLPAHTDLEK